MINIVALTGRLTTDPELKKTQSNTSVVAFRLAVERPVAKEGQERPTDFITCVAWRATAEFIAKNFIKGKMIGIVGAIQTRNYEDKNGNKRQSTEVRVRDASFCGNKERTAVAEPKQPTAPAKTEENASVAKADETRRDAAFIESEDDPPVGDYSLEEDFSLEEDLPF